jgi:hypothetical protein
MEGVRYLGGYSQTVCGSICNSTNLFNETFVPPKATKAQMNLLLDPMALANGASIPGYNLSLPAGVWTYIVLHLVIG